MTGRAKKLFGLLLCMVLLVCLMPVSAMADGEIGVICTADYDITVTFTGAGLGASSAKAEYNWPELVITLNTIVEGTPYQTTCTVTDPCQGIDVDGYFDAGEVTVLYKIHRDAVHNWERDYARDTPSTCSTPGYDAYSCSFCGEGGATEMKTTYAPHNFVSYELTSDRYGIHAICANENVSGHSPVVVSLKDMSLTYNGGDQCSDPADFVSGEGFTPGWKKSGDSINVTDEGFIVSVYTDSVITSRTYKINPAKLDCNASTGTAKGVYGSKMSELSIEGFTVTYASSGNPVAGKWAFADTVDADAVPAVGDSGEYDVYFIPDLGAENYEPLTAKVKLEISPKTVTVTGLKAVDREYDGTAQIEMDTSGAVLEGLLPSDDIKLDDVIALTNDADAEENKTIGQISIVHTGADADNYILVCNESLTVNISKREIEVTGIDVEDKVYDGTTVAVCTGTVTPVSIPIEFTVEGTPEIAFENANAGTGKKLIVSGFTVKDFKDYVVTQNFNFVLDKTADITPKPITVTVSGGLEKNYGEKDPTFGYSVSQALVGSDALGLLLVRQSGEDVGSYPFSIKSVGNDNYSVTLTAANFVINPCKLTTTNTTVTTKNFTYDGASHKGFASAEQFILDKELVEGTDFTLEGAESYTLGSHTVTVKGMGNYSGKVTATWKITLPAIAEDVTDGTITRYNVLTGLTADKIHELVILDEAVAGIKNNADATEAEKQEAEAVAAALEPIMEALEGKATYIIEPIKKWLEEKLPKADADELEMRREYEELQAWLKGEGKAWVDVVDANLGEELAQMKNKLYTYLIIVGNGSHWVTTSSDDLGFRANGHLSLFTYVKVDGKAVPRDSYTLYSGSTIVKLHNEYLKTLDKGWHDIQFVYSDGVTNVGKFQVTDRWVDVQTGDESGMGQWLSFMLMAGLGMTVCLPRLVRRKNED